MDEVYQKLLILLILILSLSIHEWAHAFAALRFGDDTAAREGRLTFNPLAHLDPVGTVLMAMTVFSGFGVGWAKPVPVNPWNIRNPKVHLPLVAFAGPLANLALCILTAGVLSIVYHALPSSSLLYLTKIFFQINFALAVFNLLPIYPLDGSKFISLFMSRDMALRYEEKVHALGYWPLLILILLGSTSLSPLGFWFALWSPLQNLILKMVGL